MSSLMREKIEKIFDNRILHHEDWATISENKKSSRSRIWWIAKTQELQEIKELILRELA